MAAKSHSLESKGLGGETNSAISGHNLLDNLAASRDFTNRQISSIVMPIVSATDRLSVFNQTVVLKAERQIGAEVQDYRKRTGFAKQELLEDLAWLTKNRDVATAGLRRLGKEVRERTKLLAKMADKPLGSEAIRAPETLHILHLLQTRVEQFGDEFEAMTEEQSREIHTIVEILKGKSISRHESVKSVLEASSAGADRALGTVHFRSGSIGKWVSNTKAEATDFLHGKIAAGAVIQSPRQMADWSIFTLGAAHRFSNEIHHRVGLKFDEAKALLSSAEQNVLQVREPVRKTLLEQEMQEKLQGSSKSGLSKTVRSALQHTKLFMSAQTSGVLSATSGLSTLGLGTSANQVRETMSRLLGEADKIDQTVVAPMETGPKPVRPEPLSKLDLHVPPRFESTNPLNQSVDGQTPPPSRTKSTTGKVSSPVQAPNLMTSPKVKHTSPPSPKTPVKDPISTTPATISVHEPVDRGTNRSEPRSEIDGSHKAPKLPDMSVKVPTAETSEVTPKEVSSQVKVGESVSPIVPTPTASKPLSTASLPGSSAGAGSQSKPGKAKAGTGTTSKRKSSPVSPPHSHKAEHNKVEKGEIEQKAKRGIQAAPAATDKPAANAPSKAVQRKGVGKAPQVDAPKLQKQLTSSSPGSPLGSETRQTLGRHIGFDPSMVRVHTGVPAETAARGLHAEAFTIGRDIFFAKDRFDPTTPKGLGLLGHEVTHVGQQLGKSVDKARFHSKSGGDQMEKEAQEAGDRIERNVAYGSTLHVTRYVRHYTPDGDGSIEAADAVRLDRISMKALKQAGLLLSKSAMPKGVRLNQLDVDVALDLSELSDEDAVGVWAEAILSAIEANAKRSQKEANLPPTSTNQLLQKSTPAPAPGLTPPTSAPPAEHLDPPTVSGDEKEIIRKLIDAKVAERLIEDSKNYDKEAKWWPFATGSVREMDKPFILETLKKQGIGSIEEFEKLKSDLIEKFGSKGVEVVQYLMAQNQRLVDKQFGVYSDPEKIKSLKASAQKMIAPLDSFIEGYNKVLQEKVIPEYPGDPSDNHAYKTLPLLYTAHRDNFDTRGQNMDSNPYLNDNDKKQLAGLYQAYLSTRSGVGGEHPYLLQQNLDPDAVLKSSVSDIESQLTDVKQAAQYVSNSIDVDRVWKLPKIVGLTRELMGTDVNPGATEFIDKKVKDVASDEKFWNYIELGAGIVLTGVAIFASAGLAAPALGLLSAISAVGAVKSLDEYEFQDAASHSALDQAKLISKDNPSLLWLAITLIGAGLDMHAAFSAFKPVAEAVELFLAAKKAGTTEAALQRLKNTAGEVYDASKGTISMSREDWVAKILDASTKGVDGAEEAVTQANILSELIQGTGLRSANIVRGNAAEIGKIVREFGNWRGLIGGLEAGGPTAKPILEGIEKWRASIIEDLAKRGAAALPDASAKAASDFDLSVQVFIKGDGQVEGSGKRLLEFDKEFSDRFGSEYSKALLINFYSPATQLNAYEEALKILPQSKAAALMKDVTKEALKLNFAREIENAEKAGQSLDEITARIKAANIKENPQELKTYAAKVTTGGKETLLLQLDKDVAAFRAAKDDASKIAAAEKVTFSQMRVNYLLNEAYIGPASLRGGALGAAGYLQKASSQLDMIQHFIANTPGGVDAAARQYEFSKYVSRYVDSVVGAGVQNNASGYIGGLAEAVYRRNREMLEKTGALAGASASEEVPVRTLLDSDIKSWVNDWNKYVEDTFPKLAAEAEKNPMKGWKPQAPPKINPAAGALSQASTTAGGPAISKVDLLGAAKNLNTAQRVAGAIYKIALADGTPAQVKSYPKDQESMMKSDLGSAYALEATGFGPKVLGIVDVGTTMVAFATANVEGTTAGGMVAQPGSPEYSAQIQTGKWITPQTYTDVTTFRDKLWEQGFYFSGNAVVGNVDSGGHWKPTNASPATPVPADEAGQNTAYDAHFLAFQIYGGTLASMQQEGQRK